MVTSIDMAKRYKLTDRNTDLTGSDINTLSLIQQIFDILLQNQHDYLMITWYTFEIQEDITKFRLISMSP